MDIIFKSISYHRMSLLYHARVTDDTQNNYYHIRLKDYPMWHFCINFCYLLIVIMTYLVLLPNA